MPLEHNIGHGSEEVFIAAKALRRSSYMALWLMLLLGLVVTVFEPSLQRWLSGRLTIVSILLTALIFVLAHIYSVRSAQRRQQLSSAQPNTALTLLIESHLQLDEAVERQLNGVVMETEYAAMSIISAARTINLNADALPTMFDQASSQADLLAMLHEGNLILSTNITEILGQLQFQDVVRQRVARAVIAIGQRNVVFKELMQDIELNELTLLPLAQDMRNALEQYVQNEKLHAAALNNGVDQDAALPKIEFF